MLGGAAGLMLFGDMLQVGAEIYGSTLIASMRGSAFDARNTALEALFGGHVHAGSFVFGAAGGPSLGEAPGSAPRLVLTLAFAPALKYQTPLEVPTSTLDDRDQDGILDSAGAAAQTPRGRRVKMPPSTAARTLPRCSKTRTTTASTTRTTRVQPNAATVRTTRPRPAARQQSDRDGDGIVDNGDACPEPKG